MKEDFSGQKTKEKHIKTFRKNPLTLWKKVIKFLIFITISVLCMTYLSQLEFLSFVSNYINIAALVGIIFSLSYGFYVWMCWYYDVYILTSARIINVEQKGLFSREVKEIDIVKIQDITYSVTGFFSTVMEVGSVKVHSSSGLDIEMNNVSKPGTVREVIVKLMERADKVAVKGPSADEIAEALAQKIIK